MDNKAETMMGLIIEAQTALRDDDEAYVAVDTEGTLRFARILTDAMSEGGAYASVFNARTCPAELTLTLLTFLNAEEI